MKTDGESRSKILVIDDDVELTTTVKAILESQGLVVGTANDRASGMEKAGQEENSTNLNRQKSALKSDNQSVIRLGMMPN